MRKDTHARGFIKIHRTLFSHWLWEESRKFSRFEAFVDLIQQAAYKPRQYADGMVMIELDAGEIVASLRFLSQRWRWGKDKVSAYLSYLESDGICRREIRQGQTVIILCNYKDYNAPHPQPSDSAQDARADTEPDTNPDTDPPQNPTNKKKEKEREREKTHDPAHSEGLHATAAAARDFDVIVGKINQLHPTWKRVPHLADTERRELLENLPVFRDLEDPDWTMLAEYLRDDTEDLPGKFWQPDQRSRFITNISDVISYADRWKYECRKRGIPVANGTNGHHDATPAAR